MSAISPFSWAGKLSPDNLEDVITALLQRLGGHYTLIEQNTYKAPDHREEHPDVQLRDEGIRIERDQPSGVGWFHVLDTSPLRVWGARTDSETTLVLRKKSITVSHNVGADEGHRQTITLIPDSQKA